MSTSHPLIATTRPNYATGSGLCLEIKFDGQEEWSKLKDAEPYAHNKPVSTENQVKALEATRDGWVSHGVSKYRTASYRIGEYKFVPELEGYAWADATPTPVK